MDATQANELAVIVQDSGLDTSKVDNLLSNFADSFQSAKSIVEEAKDIVVTDESQKDEMDQARAARLELKNIRVQVEHTRKQLKEQSLREGRAIDGIANVIKAVVVPVEEHLERQEKFAERLAAERKAKRDAERRARLIVYVDDLTAYAYEDIEDAAFERLITTLDEAKEAREAAELQARRIEEEVQKKAEAERIEREKAAAKEAERIRKENAKLRAEAEAREAELATQRAAEQKRLAAERAEQEKKLAAERALAEAERKKREAIEAEQKAKVEAESIAKAQAEEATRKALLAPDKEKLLVFARTIEQIEMPNVANREAGKLLDETKDFLERISKNLRQKAQQL